MTLSTKQRGRFLIWMLLLALLLHVAGVLRTDALSMDNGRDSDDFVYVESVDVRDRDAMLEWARGICRGVTIEEAALSENVEPNILAVVNALAGSLHEATPDETRSEVAEICRLELEDFDRRSKEIAAILVDELPVPPDGAVLDEYKDAAAEILRHVMAKETEQDLASTVGRVLAEFINRQAAADRVDIIAQRVAAI